ncbi:hypothetical protein FA13DRAFT_1743100, partial [Coprinellus micaceus]
GKGKWKGPVARLAMVNHSFFYASAGIVWEHMDSFEPFCSILAQVSSSAFTENSWKRFDLYSIHTKTLVLNDPVSLSSNLSRAFHMGSSNGRSGAFFPSLKGLFLNSADPVSFFIAFTVSPHVRLISIDLPPASTTEESKDAILALTQHLGRTANSLTHAHFLRPFSQRVLGHLQSVSTLQIVQLAIPSAEYTAIGQSFWAPYALLLWEAFPEQESEETYTTSRDSYIANLTPWALSHARPARPELLLGTSQFFSAVANHAYGPAPPQPFNTFVLRLCGESLPNAEALGSFTIAKFLGQNPHFTEVMIHGSKKKVHRSAVGRFRSNPAFRNTGAFLAQLAASRNPTAVSFDWVRFPPGDIIFQVLDILPNLPKLTKFRFLPVPISTAEVDALTVPPLSCLEVISRSCPDLEELALLVDLFDPVSKLQILYLPPSRGLPQHTVQQSVRAATYLYLLFPHLSPLASCCKEGGDAERAWWGDIDEIISTLKLVQRAGATRQPGRS